MRKYLKNLTKKIWWKHLSGVSSLWLRNRGTKKQRHQTYTNFWDVDVW